MFPLVQDVHLVSGCRCRFAWLVLTACACNVCSSAALKRRVHPTELNWAEHITITHTRSSDGFPKINVTV